MLRPVVLEVTALAERREVARPVVGWIVIAMSRSENNACRGDHSEHVFDI